MKILIGGEGDEGDDNLTVENPPDQQSEAEAFTRMPQTDDQAGVVRQTIEKHQRDRFKQLWRLLQGDVRVRFPTNDPETPPAIKAGVLKKDGSLAKLGTKLKINGKKGETLSTSKVLAQEILRW